MTLWFFEGVASGFTRKSSLYC